MTLAQFKRAVRDRNHEMILRGVAELREAGGVSENEIYRIALAGDPGLDRHEWDDLVQPEKPEYGLGYMQGRGAS